MYTRGEKGFGLRNKRAWNLPSHPRGEPIQGFLVWDALSDPCHALRISPLNEKSRDPSKRTSAQQTSSFDSSWGPASGCEAKWCIIPMPSNALLLESTEPRVWGSWTLSMASFSSRVGGVEKEKIFVSPLRHQTKWVCVWGHVIGNRSA